MYETGKCAIDAYFAYENSGGKLNGDVVKGVAGAVVMGGLTAFGIHGAANKVDNLSRAISDPTGCFVAGTQVPTVDGYKNIEDIEVGDQVYSENPYTGEKGYKKVVETYIKEKHTIVYLKVNNETIETTNEHPFWVEEENAFVKAEDLEVGDTLRLRDGETVTLEGIESKTSEDITKVYNFQVADWHTYYVTDMDILVHNNCMGLADRVGVAVERKGWKLGDPIDNLTRAVKKPAWSTVRKRYWKNEVMNNAENYSEENCSRMKKGLAPQQYNEITGKVESMELHHVIPQRTKLPGINNINNLKPVWPDEHEVIDPYRFTGGK